MAGDAFPITEQGFALMEEELKDLKTVQRYKISQEIAVARDHGDLKENAEYHAAREKQSFIEGRINELEDKVARAEVIDITKLSGDVVKFGAIVTLIDEDTEEEVTYQIVGEYEAKIEQKQISVASPLARALIGKKKGSSVEFTTPRATKSYEIIGVKYK